MGIPFNAHNPETKWKFQMRQYIFSHLFLPSSFLCVFSSSSPRFIYFPAAVLHSAVINSFTFWDVIVFLPLCSHWLPFHFIMLPCFIKSMCHIKFLKSKRNFSIIFCVSPGIRIPLNVYFIYILTYIFLFFDIKFCFRVFFFWLTS